MRLASSGASSAWATIGADQQLRSAGVQVALGGTDDPFVEAADKTLLGGKHDHDISLGASGFARRWFGCWSEGECLPDRFPDYRCICADAVEPAARLPRTGSGAAAHRGDDRFELMDRADAAFDLAELAAHGAFAC